MALARKRWRTDGQDLALDLRDSLPSDFPPPVPTDFRKASDSIVFRGPPPVAGDAASDEFAAERAFPILAQLRILPREPGGLDGRKSTGWFGSILLHGALVLLVAVLLAPADRGGRAIQTLVMTISDQDPVILTPMMLVDEIATEDAPSQRELEPTPETPEPADVSLDFGPPSVKIGGMNANAGQSIGDFSGGSRGSFFGIEAVGQDFVYIVDRSGSMNGDRYRRAIDELKRSVHDLREDQRFFVVLFSNTSTPMLGETSFAFPQMFDATEENKQKLDEWLRDRGPGGGTNPNSSLRMALRMKPSAVFMLSDGEFTESKASRRGNLLQAAGGAFEIVQAAGGSIPIHAIAFEDPRSCKNMQKLASMTGGEYRFVNSSGKTQSELVADARALLAQPKSKSRSNDLSSIAGEFGSSEIDVPAKRAFSRWLVEEYESSRGESVVAAESGNAARLEEMMELLILIVAADPRREACADLQDQVAGDLSRLLHQITQPKDRVKVCDRLLRMKRSAAAASVLDRLTDHFQSLDQDDPNKAFARLRLVQSVHPESKLVAVCQATCDQISASVIGKAEALLAGGDVTAAIKTLRASQQNPSHRILASVTRQTLRDLTMDQLLAARNASLRHDRELNDKINADLEKGFESDPLLVLWQAEFVDRELHARRILQRIEHGNAFSGLKLQRQQLESLVRQYPETVAATKAREQLKRLPKWEAARDKQEAELIRMMDETPRR